MSFELGEVRTEDAFDVEAVHEWLQRNSSVPAHLPEVHQFGAGASNLTYLLTYKDQELILRRPPVGTKAASAHDMKREFTIQKILLPDFPLVPQVVALCEDLSVIGSDFYVMKKIEGIILRRDMPKGLSLTIQELAIIGDLVIDGLKKTFSPFGKIKLFVLKRISLLSKISNLNFTSFPFSKLFNKSSYE